MIALFNMLNELRAQIGHNEKRVLLSNVAFLSVLQILNYILPLVTVPYIVKVVGIENFGRISFAMALGAYLQIVVDYGFNLTATSNVALNRADYSEVCRIYSAVMHVKISLLLLMFAILWLLLLLPLDIFLDSDIFFYAFLSVLGNAFIPIWLFQGLEKMQYITGLTFVGKAFFAISVFLFVQDSSDYVLVPALAGVGAIISGVIAVTVVRCFLNVDFIFVSFTEFKGFIADGWFVFLSQLKTSLFSHSNTVLLGVFFGSGMVGVFSAAEKLVRAFASLQVPITQALYPYVGRKLKEDRGSAIELVFLVAKVGGCLYLLGTAIVLIASNYIITLLYGVGSDDVVVVFQVLMMIPTAIFLNNMFGTQVLLNLRRDRTYFRIVLIAGLINLALLMPLSFLFGALGAAVSVLAAELYVVAGTYYYAKRERCI